MHRTGSTTRASDEFYLMNNSQGRSALEIDQLPTYDPQSEASKKEAVRVRVAENMVHLIPVVVILCALVLWFFSYPEIDAVNRDDVLARVKNMTIEGYRTSNWNSSAIATGGVEDIDPIDGIGMEDPGKESNSKDPE